MSKLIKHEESKIFFLPLPWWTRLLIRIMKENPWKIGFFVMICIAFSFAFAPNLKEVQVVEKTRVIMQVDTIFVNGKATIVNATKSNVPSAPLGVQRYVKRNYPSWKSPEGLAFCQRNIPVIRKNCPGIPIELVLAQCWLESNFFSSKLAEQGWNGFGIKHMQGPYVEANDDCGNKACRFQKFNNPVECYQAYHRVMQKYRPEVNDLWGSCSRLTSGKLRYATDPHYTRKIYQLSKNIKQWLKQNKLL